MSKPLVSRLPFDLVDHDAGAGPAYVIGLDPATSFGWGVLRPDGTRAASGQWDLSLRKGEGAAMPLVRLRGLLSDLHRAFPDAVYGYELVERHVRYINGRQETNTYAAQQYGRLVGTALGYIQTITDRYIGIPVGTVKKAATGKGNASKEAMLAAAVARWSSDCLDSSRPPVQGEDEADALWVAMAALDMIPAAW